MKFWQQLRWQITAANMLVALVGIIVVLVVVVAVSGAMIPGDLADAIQASPAGSVIGEGSGDDVVGSLPVLWQVFVASAFLAVIIAVIASLIVSLTVTHGIMYSLEQLAHKSRRIADGLYDDRLAVDGDDELAQLTTSFNHMAEALEQIQETRVALVGYLSHELRTPLSGVSGYIEGIMDGVFPDTEATLTLMYGEVRRMRRLVDDLQSLSRVQAGQVSLRMGTFELPSFVRRATVKLQPQWITRGVDVQVEPSEQPLIVFADPDRVDQVLINLLANSLTNTPEGGKVTVEIVQDGGFARVDIHDTGYGISEEELPYIFERYYRSNNSHSHENSGSGIGLTISRHLAWAMGGDLTAHSEGLGKGCTFSFLLPISKSHVAKS